MKRIVGMIAVVMIIHGNIYGMYTTVDTSQQIRAVQDKFANVPFSFDEKKFESKLNPEISGKMIKLLNWSLVQRGFILDYWTISQFLQIAR